MNFFFFWKVAYLHFIWLFPWGFIFSLHLGQKPSTFSSWLTFCGVIFGSSHCGTVVLFASYVFPLMEKAKRLV